MYVTALASLFLTLLQAVPTDTRLAKHVATNRKKEPVLSQTSPWGHRWLLPFADQAMEQFYQRDHGGKMSSHQLLLAGDCILIALVRLVRVYLGVEIDGADSLCQISSMVLLGLTGLALTGRCLTLWKSEDAGTAHQIQNTNAAAVLVASIALTLLIGDTVAKPETPEADVFMFAGAFVFGGPHYVMTTLQTAWWHASLANFILMLPLTTCLHLEYTPAALVVVCWLGNSGTMYHTEYNNRCAFLHGIAFTTAPRVEGPGCSTELMKGRGTGNGAVADENSFLDPSLVQAISSTLYHQEQVLTIQPMMLTEVQLSNPPQLGTSVNDVAQEWVDHTAVFPTWHDCQVDTLAEVMPEAGARQQARKADQITRPVLEEHFHCPMAAVAGKFGVSETYFKRICRKHGIMRWPYRQVNSQKSRTHTRKPPTSRGPLVDLAEGHPHQLDEAGGYDIDEGMGALLEDAKLAAAHQQASGKPWTAHEDRVAMQHVIQTLGAQLEESKQTVSVLLRQMNHLSSLHSMSCTNADQDSNISDSSTDQSTSDFEPPPHNVGSSHNKRKALPSETPVEELFDFTGIICHEDLTVSIDVSCASRNFHFKPNTIPGNSTALCKEAAIDTLAVSMAANAANCAIPGKPPDAFKVGSHCSGLLFLEVKLDGQNSNDEGLAKRVRTNFEELPQLQFHASPYMEHISNERLSTATSSASNSYQTNNTHNLNRSSFTAVEELAQQSGGFSVYNPAH